MPATLDFKRAQFLISSPTLKKCPAEDGAEVAFAGRSNAGKSSAINALTGDSKLARTSKTPGRTQLINFFSLGTEQQRLVDLPGYGYAKVPLAVKNEWQEHLSEYLQKRMSLRGLVLLMDIRHPMQEFDCFMLNWSLEIAMPLHVLLTKSDKLSRGAAKNTQLKVQQHLNKSQGDNKIWTVQTFSALKGEGLPQLEQVLTQWLKLDLESAEEAPAGEEPHS